MAFSADPYFMRSLIRHLPGLVVTVINREHRYVFAEGDALALIDRTVSDYRKKSVQDMVDPRRLEYTMGMFARAWDGQTVHEDYETPNGTVFDVRMVRLDVPDSGEFIMTISRDVTADRARMRLAKKDTLTGLDRRAVLDAFVSHRAASGHGVAVLFIDVDHFKHVNDTYGHAVGDDILRRISSVLQTFARSGDLAVRLGGDEFVVVLLDACDPGVVAERLRVAVLDVTSPLGAGCSLGLAVFPVDGTTCSELMKVADTRMYADKKSRVPAVRD